MFGWSQDYGVYHGLDPSGDPTYEFSIPGSLMSYSNNGCMSVEPSTAYIYELSTPLYSPTYFGVSKYNRCIMSIPAIMLYGTFY